MDNNHLDLQMFVSEILARVQKLGITSLYWRHMGFIADKRYYVSNCRQL